MSRNNIAFLMIDVPDLSGAGGAERFFYDFFNRNNSSGDSTNTIHFYTNDARNLKNVSYLNENEKYLHVFKLHRNRYLKRLTEKIIVVRSVSNAVRDFFTFIQLYIHFLRNDIKVLHVPLYESKDYNLIWFFDKLAIYKRPKISVSIVDCRIPYRYFSEDREHYYSSKINYGSLFKNISIDGIFSWYELFKKFAGEKGLLKKTELIYCVNSRYSIVENVECWDEKQNLIVFAGRLDDQKDPEFFLQAINEVVKRNRQKDYSFKIYGKGPLKEKLHKYIQDNNLSTFVEIDFCPRMKDVFTKSKCFISTQLYENFPSMSMAEAMACENGIIAKNVGQTEYFVKDSYNGFLVSESNVLDLADKIVQYIELPENEKRKLGKNSALNIKNVHNFPNFRRQFNEYIEQILA